MSTGCVDFAVVGTRLFTGLDGVSADFGVLDAGGQWVVVIPFSGPPLCARFESVSPAQGWAGVLPGGPSAGRWRGSDPGAWASSLDADGYHKAVAAVQEAIADGDVYQVNVCRRLEAPIAADADLADLGALLTNLHPAPYEAVVSLPSLGTHVVSASPECFLRRRGRSVESRPIKGTAAVGAELTAKDRAENVMIVDLVRNDLGRVCEWGSVDVPRLWQLEQHPGLTHLVSTVRGRLRHGLGWADLLDATFPPGSVTGAPKHAALEMVSQLEPVARGVYCGAVGWVDGDRREGVLNVAIRTFWLEHGVLCFGTGAGITWDSSPAAEWAETELKAAQLLRLASAGGTPA